MPLVIIDDTGLLSFLYLIVLHFDMAKSVPVLITYCCPLLAILSHHYHSLSMIGEAEGPEVTDSLWTRVSLGQLFIDCVYKVTGIVIHTQC